MSPGTPNTEGGPKRKKHEKQADTFREIKGLERHLEGQEEVQQEISDVLEEVAEITAEEQDYEGYLQEEIRRLKQELGGEEEYEQAMEESMMRVNEFDRKKEKIEEKKKKLKKCKEKLLLQANKNEELANSTEFWDKIQHINSQIEAMEGELERARKENPDAFVTYEMRKLQEYREQLQESGIVETPYVREKQNEIEEKLLKNGTVALVGETGTGKTKIAEKLARKVSGKAPEWVFGHSKMSKEDLLYHLGIEPAQTEAMDVPEMIEKAKKEYKNRHEGQEEDDEVMETAMEQIEEVIKGQSQEMTMETEVVLGPVLSAAKEGRTVIIDEFNYIQPQLLAGLNALVEAQPGEEVEYMGQKVEVEEGFNIIFTGNMTKADFDRYQDRQELDPAFINRLNSGLIEYNTPPQDTEKNFSEIIPKEGEETAEVDKDLFLIALTNLVNESGDLKAKEDTLEQAWKLSRSFEWMQKIYAGDDIREEIGTESGTSFNMKKYHASLRTFGDILQDWKRDAFETDLEWHIYDNLLRPSEMVAPKETAQMYYLLNSSYGGNFFEGEVWDEVEVDTTSWTIKGLDKAAENIDPDEDLQSDAEEKYYIQDDIARITAGETLPEEREEAKEQQEQAEEHQERMETYREYREKIEELEDTIENYQDTVERFCEDEREIMSA